MKKNVGREYLYNLDKRLNDEAQERREKRYSRISEILRLRTEFDNIGIECTEITPFQYLIIKGDYQIDYYPTSGKYFDINQYLWGQIEPKDFINLFPLSIPWNEDL